MIQVELGQAAEAYLWVGSKLAVAHGLFTRTVVQGVVSWSRTRARSDRATQTPPELYVGKLHE